MADGLGLLSNGDMVLRVRPVEPAVALWPTAASATTLVQEKLRLAQILLITGNTIQLAQPDFDFLMSGGIGAFAFGEDGAEQVCVFGGDVQEGLVPGDLVMSDGTFVHMPHAVLLVNRLDVGPEFFRLPLGYGVKGKQIPIFPLCAGHYLDYLVQVQSHHRIGIHLQRIRGTFHDFVNI